MVYDEVAYGGAAAALIQCSEPGEAASVQGSFLADPVCADTESLRVSRYGRKDEKRFPGENISSKGLYLLSMPGYTSLIFVSSVSPLGENKDFQPKQRRLA